MPSIACWPAPGPGDAAMMFLRSLVFNIVFYPTLAVVVLILWVLLPLPRMVMQRAFRVWMRVLMWIMRVVLNLTYEVRGLENLPAGAAVIASKHQSAWDTGFFYLVLDDPAYVLKRELLSIPLYGWYLRRAGMISVDRAAGASALKNMMRDSLAMLKEERQVVIFPEGTRTAPGTRRPYHPGVAGLYARTEAPLVPVAINSGVFWPRRSFIKRPGRVIVEFLPAIPNGLDRAAFMKELQGRIESATDRLCAEAYAAYPHTAQTAPAP